MSSHHDFHNSIYIYEIEMKRYTDIEKEREGHTEREREKGEGRGERGKGRGRGSIFCGVQQWWNNKLRLVIKWYLGSTAVMFFGVRGHIFYNNFVLYDSIVFIHVPNKLYVCWLSVDIVYVYLCGILYRQAKTLSQLNHRNEILAV